MAVFPTYSTRAISNYSSFKTKLIAGLQLSTRERLTVSLLGHYPGPGDGTMFETPGTCSVSLPCDLLLPDLDNPRSHHIPRRDVSKGSRALQNQGEGGTYPTVAFEHTQKTNLHKTYTVDVTCCAGHVLTNTKPQMWYIVSTCINMSVHVHVISM